MIPLVTLKLRRVPGVTTSAATKLVLIAAALVSIVAYLVTAQIKAVLAYGDAVSHLEIARRTIDGNSRGLGQMGGVWPPLPHLLILPLVWVNRLYYDGFAGSAVSMVAFVVTVLLVYKIVRQLTGSNFPALVAAAVLGLSINMLYMQSTPMTESLLLCALAAAVYWTQQWAYTDHYPYLIRGGVAAMLATLTRYESWPVVVFLLGAVAVIASRKGRSREAVGLKPARAVDRVVAYGVPAVAGVLSWFLWNWVIFGNPFNFQNGDYAKPSLWLTKNEPAIGHWVIAAKTYWYAMGDDVTWPVLSLAVVGFLAFCAIELRHRDTGVMALPVLALVVSVPFYVVSLYTGQRPLHVEQVNHNLYNIRFGLIALLPAAIFIGYLTWAVRLLHRYLLYPVGAAVLLSLVSTAGWVLVQGNAATLVEARGSTTPFAKHVAAVVASDYTGGRVLMESFGNEGIAFRAIPTRQLVYEGSYRLWKPALRSPSTNHIAWIIARCGQSPDRVCRGVNQGELARYQLASSLSDGSDTYYIYRLAPPGAL